MIEDLKKLKAQLETCLARIKSDARIINEQNKRIQELEHELEVLNRRASIKLVQ